MAIPEAQLDTWSHQGSITQSKETYATIRTALLSQSALYKNKDFEVFLQGSYGNDTNIYAESDVDTVIRLDSIMRGDVSALPPDQQVAYHQAHGAAEYTFAEFKSGVVTRMTTAFGEDAKLGNKAIRIKSNGSRRNADVVVCYQYRRYTYFYDPNNCHYNAGIVFPMGAGGEIINYPKLHSENLTTKHQATNSWFKPMVRILKNMRSRLVADGVIASGTAPSYYVEGMLFNVPNDKFGKSYDDTFVNSINWLIAANRSSLLCAHGQHALLGWSNVQWSEQNCTKFLNALVALWNNW